MTTNAMEFNAGDLAPAWLAVQQFSVKDDSPVLNKTVCIEEYVDGVRLVATNRYVVLTAWVPTLDKEGPAPDVDEAPVAVHVAHDGSRRAGGLLTHLLALASEDDAPLVRVELSFVDIEAEDASPVFAGMETEGVRIEQPGVERVTLATCASEFPSWRTLYAGFAEVRTASIGLNPDQLGALAKAAKFFPNCPIEWRCGGPNKVARIDFHEALHQVSGLVMPMRLRSHDDEAGDE